MHKITVIRGDGVGPEISDATMRVIEAAGVNCEWDFALIGHEAEKASGEPLPAETLAKIRASGVVLKSPVIIEKMGSKIIVAREDGSQRIYSNVNTALRLEMGAFVNVRPVRNFEGVKAHTHK
ncbi:MAG: isocitrate/isopropylmalate family dehydrogenase, partial [Blastocatellia bacterium]